MEHLTIIPGKLDLAQLRHIFTHHVELSLASDVEERMSASLMEVESVVDEGRTAYGINTGFGLLAQKRIPKEQVKDLQKKIILSHAAGVGGYIKPDVARLIVTLKINSLARGYSGIRPEVLKHMLALYNAKLYPCIKSKGSVGASGDLAPLSNLAAILMGVGKVYDGDQIIDAAEGLKKAGLEPLEFGPKEGLAMLNGTQVSTALALQGLFMAENVFAAAILAGSLSVEAAKGSHKPFDARIHEIRGQSGQIKVSQWYRDTLDGGDIAASHVNCSRVQDPYCLRCQPQVMGACLDQIEHVAQILLRESNAVTDNPLIFSDTHDIISGGNFHAEPVALVADVLALSIAEIGSISERRIALLIDPSFSGLPAFLVKESGLNSGFMLAQVTAAALASENKSRAHPASVDSIPTSANQEDHVSMATFAARRLKQMAMNTMDIVGIELLAAAQGIEYHQPLQPSPKLQKVFQQVRKYVPFYDVDRLFYPDIENIVEAVRNGEFNSLFPSTDLPSFS